MVLEIINQMSKNQKSSLIVWNTVVSQMQGSKAFYCANLQETIQQSHLMRPFDHQVIHVYSPLIDHQVIHFYPKQWTYINNTLVHGTSHTGNLNWMVLLTCSHFKTGDTHFG